MPSCRGLLLVDGTDLGKALHELEAHAELVVTLKELLRVGQRFVRRRSGVSIFLPDALPLSPSVFSRCLFRSFSRIMRRELSGAGFSFGASKGTSRSGMMPSAWMERPDGV